MENENKKKTIKEWRPDEQPRERLLKFGPKVLSDSELLAIILRTGTRSSSAKDIGNEILDKFGAFSELEKCTIGQLSKINGIGPTKAITLAAVFEIAARIKTAPFDEKKIIRSPQDLADFYILRFRALEVEEFHVLLLNTSNQVKKDILISTGTLNASIVHPRDVFRQAVIENAASVILLHNHPSGNPTPSKEDISLTKQIVEAGKMMNISVFDHLIVAGDDYYSFAKNGLI
jgi:DNA repair protein RadC